MSGTPVQYPCCVRRDTATVLAIDPLPPFVALIGAFTSSIGVHVNMQARAVAGMHVGAPLCFHSLPIGPI